VLLLGMLFPLMDFFSLSSSSVPIMATTHYLLCVTYYARYYKV
jgi:hypothetical protein